MTRDADRQGAAPVQQVRIERRGGLAGLHVAVERDYAALTPRQRDALDRVAAASAASAPATGVGAVQPGADRFSYRIRLTAADGAQRVIDLPEDGLPAALAEVVEAGLP